MSSKEFLASLLPTSPIESSLQSAENRENQRVFSRVYASFGGNIGDRMVKRNSELWSENYAETPLQAGAADYRINREDSTWTRGFEPAFCQIDPLADDRWLEFLQRHPYARFSTLLSGSEP